MRRECAQVICAMSSMLLLSVFLSNAAMLDMASYSPVRTHVSAFTVHDPILVEGDFGFTNSSGVIWGSGTESDPYVIDGWDIDASTVNGIEIRNTEAHFVVSNCFVHSSTLAYSGILLGSCANGTLEGSSSSGNHYGIRLDSSNGIAIDNNTCSEGFYGIILSESSCDNTISNNSCTSNQLDGMELYHLCSRNTISNNTCSDNLDGIHLEASADNVLRGNIMMNNGISVIGALLSDCNTHDIDTSNTVNGKPIRYYKNESGMVVPAGAGEVLLANCSDITIGYQSLCDATIGIEIAFSSRITISNNTCLNNTYGILLWSSEGNTLTNNTIANNDISPSNWWYGIGLRSSSDNVVTDNYCAGSRYGIGLSYASCNNTISGNDCSNNQLYGMQLYSLCDNITIHENVCSGNLGGIILDSSNDNGLNNNTCSHNSQHGIWLVWSDDNVLSGNTLLENSEYAMNLVASTGNIIWNNTFVNNNGAGDTHDPSHVQASDDGTGNWWNGTDGYGNYWSDWTTPDTNLPYGIVDLPYDIAGGGGARDNYPLTTAQNPIPEFGMMPLVSMCLLVTIMLARKAGRRKLS